MDEMIDSFQKVKLEHRKRVVLEIRRDLEADKGLSQDAAGQI